MNASSSNRKWPARVLLVLAGLWIFAKVLEVISSLGHPLYLARALDFTNPSLFGIVGFVSLIAYFFVRPKKHPAGTSMSSSVMKICPKCKGNVLENETSCVTCGEPMMRSSETPDGTQAVDTSSLGHK
jgi:hypothetical protein